MKRNNDLEVSQYTLFYSASKIYMYVGQLNDIVWFGHNVKGDNILHN